MPTLGVVARGFIVRVWECIISVWLVVGPAHMPHVLIYTAHNLRGRVSRQEGLDMLWAPQRDEQQETHEGVEAAADGGGKGMANGQTRVLGSVFLAQATKGPHWANIKRYKSRDARSRTIP